LYDFPGFSFLLAAFQDINANTGTLCRNVKRWRNANMAWRWAGTVLLEAEKRFHGIRAYRQMPVLIEALSKGVDKKDVVA
jgi:hypothetical protein